MKMLILGGNGMAGHVLLQYFREHAEYDVVYTSRDPADAVALHLDALNFAEADRILERVRPDVVINAIGILNQAAEQQERIAKMVNGVFPHWIAGKLDEMGYGRKLVHISTDCVFSGATDAPGYDIERLDAFCGLSDHSESEAGNGGDSLGSAENIADNGANDAADSGSGGESLNVTDGAAVSKSGGESLNVTDGAADSETDGAPDSGMNDVANNVEAGWANISSDATSNPSVKNDLNSLSFTRQSYAARKLPGRYQESDAPDGSSVYARTKADGEVVHSPHLTIRTSIIGPEIRPNGIGLLGWFLGQSSLVDGYTNVLWNGVTTLQLAKSIDRLLHRGTSGLVHLAAPEVICKHDLLHHFADVFDKRDVRIVPSDGQKLDRTLTSTRNDVALDVPDYVTMLNELRDWMRSR